MKNLILLLAITLTFSCCNNDDDNNSNANLPPATQTGANTVGCLVNGQIFLPHQEGLNAPVNCYYQKVGGEFYFSLAFADLRGSANETVNVFTAAIELQENQTYTLDQPDTPNIGGGGEYRTSQSNQYNTNLIQTGELTITRLDLGNSIISGTFWFDAKNTNGDIVQIREGRFDWNFY